MGSLSISEISDETQLTITTLYREILHRVPDDDGMRYYGTLLESGEITEDELGQIIFDSDESYNIRLDTAEKILVDDLIQEFFDRRATQKELDYFNHIIYVL